MNGIHDDLSEGNSISYECANAVFGICVSEGLVCEDYSIDLNVTKDKVKEVLDSNIPPTCSQEYYKNECAVLETIMLSRYVNLFYLLRVSLHVLSHIQFNYVNESTLLLVAGASL